MHQPRASPPVLASASGRDALALGALAISCGLLAGGLSGSPAWLVIGAVLAIPAGLLLLRRSLLGPLFYYEVLRLARRGRSSLVRTLYLLGILAGIGIVYYHYFPSRGLGGLLLAPAQRVPLGQLAHLNQAIVQSVFVVQTIAVLLFTPGYLAGTVAEEREAGTLPLLFTTHLTDREIIVGKLFARLAHIALVLLGTLPVLALLLVWGGVDPALLAAGFAATFLSLFSVGAWSILCSVLSRSVFTAMIGSYMGVVVVGVCGLGGSSPIATSPLALVSQTYDRLMHSDSTAPMTSAWDVAAGLLGGYAALHFLLGTAWTIWAIRALRQPVDLPPLITPPVSFPPDAAPPGSEVLATQDTFDLLVTPPCIPVDDRPLLWKEMYHGSGWLPGPGPRSLLRWGHRHGLTLALLVLGFLVVSVCWGAWTERAWARDEGTQPFRLFLVFLQAGWCVAVGYRAAESVSRERQQRTLASLLMLPVEPRDILAAKWVGSIFRFRVLGYALGGVLVWGLLFGALHPLSLLVVAFSIVATVTFIASVGLWISVISPDTLRSRLLMTLGLLLFFFGSWLASTGGAEGHTGRQFQVSLWDEVQRLSFNPAASWWLGCYSWFGVDGESARPPGVLAQDSVAIMLGTLSWGVLAVSFWLLAVRRFRRG
jgi:ABC-type transport system involved in multi-copper enzyme maturation permease subunit